MTQKYKKNTNKVDINYVCIYILQCSYSFCTEGSKHQMKKDFKNSVSVKILGIPMAVMFIIITVMASASISISRNKIISQMQADGISIGSQISKSVEKNSNSIEALNESINDRVRTLGGFIVANNSTINNDYLKALAKQFKVNEINVTDASGKVIYSNLNENIGYVFESKSAGQPVLNGEQPELMEDIRKSTTSSDFYKYGYVKNSNGGMVQIGILSNEVAKLTDAFNVQNVINDLVKDKSMVYALYMNKDLRVEAHSDKSRIGNKLTDIGSKTAAVNGKVYSSEYKYKDKIPVYDVIVPVYKNGHLNGAVDIGMSMENVGKTVYGIIIIIAGLSIAAFIIFALILIRISKGITVPLNNLVDVSKRIADGELDNEINIKSSDEIGILAAAFRGMSNTLKNTISVIKNGALKVNTMSEELNSNSEEMTNAISGVTQAIQDVAQGATEQANDLTSISDILSKFAQEVDSMNDKLSKVNENSNVTEVKAQKGRQEIKLLLKSINDVSESFKVVTDKINRLNSNVARVEDITGIIDGIADQTNLLALNASIEAARAGEAGKGFAVVADEIRKLAEKSQKSTEEIHTLIKGISTEAGDVTETSNSVKVQLEGQATAVSGTIESFRDMLSAIKDIAILIQDTYKSIEIIEKSKETILEKVESLTAISEETAASSEEISASSEEMYSSSENVANFAGELNKVASELALETDKFQI